MSIENRHGIKFRKYSRSYFCVECDGEFAIEELPNHTELECVSLKHGYDNVCGWSLKFYKDCECYEGEEHAEKIPTE